MSLPFCFDVGFVFVMFNFCFCFVSCLLSDYEKHCLLVSLVFFLVMLVLKSFISFQFHVFVLVCFSCVVCL